MKKIFSIFLALSFFVSMPVNAGKDKDKKDRPDDRYEKQNEPYSFIGIKCPYCTQLQTISYKLNTYYFVDCNSCRNKMLIDTRFANISIAKTH